MPLGTERLTVEVTTGLSMDLLLKAYIGQDLRLKPLRLIYNLHYFLTRDTPSFDSVGTLRWVFRL